MKHFLWPLLCLFAFLAACGFSSNQNGMSATASESIPAELGEVMGSFSYQVDSDESCSSSCGVRLATPIDLYFNEVNQTATALWRIEEHVVFSGPLHEDGSFDFQLFLIRATGEIVDDPLQCTAKITTCLDVEHIFTHTVIHADCDSPTTGACELLFESMVEHLI